MIERLIIAFDLKTWDNKSIALFSNSAKLLPIDYNLPISWAKQEKDIIRDALIKCNGKQKDATILLNLSESTLCRRIKPYRLKQRCDPAISVMQFPLCNFRRESHRMNRILSVYGLIMQHFIGIPDNMLSHWNPIPFHFRFAWHDLCSIL